MTIECANCLSKASCLDSNPFNRCPFCGSIYAPALISAARQKSQAEEYKNIWFGWMTALAVALLVINTLWLLYRAKSNQLWVTEDEFWFWLFSRSATAVAMLLAWYFVPKWMVARKFPNLKRN